MENKKFTTPEELLVNKINRVRKARESEIDESDKNVLDGKNKNITLENKKNNMEFNYQKNLGIQRKDVTQASMPYGGGEVESDWTSEDNEEFDAKFAAGNSQRLAEKTNSYSQKEAAEFDHAFAQEQVKRHSNVPEETYTEEEKTTFDHKF